MLWCCSNFIKAILDLFAVLRDFVLAERQKLWFGGDAKSQAKTAFSLGCLGLAFHSAHEVIVDDKGSLDKSYKTSPMTSQGLV